jgi:5'-methylthioadenosine phosphorylase
MINYRANILFLKKTGVRFVFAFNSVGSLKKEIVPGSFFIAADYMDFNPPTFYDKSLQHITPEISDFIQNKFEIILKKLGLNYKKGIYFQSKGPRLETIAEVGMIKKFADVVGMTMGSEATLAQEIGLEYASLCSVDNYANGLFGRPLREDEIIKKQKKSTRYIDKIISEIQKL